MVNAPADKRFNAPFEPLSAAARAASLRDTLAARPGGGDVWLFGYGGLMWDPRIRHADARPARIAGWRRSFCIWTLLARGTPERPGLALALDRGGACDGVAFRIAEADVEDALRQVWDREMYTGIYRPRWLPTAVGGAEVDAIAFTVEHTHPQYAGAMPADTAARYIAKAHGENGACRDYLANTVRHLAELGIDEPDLRDLLRRVDKIATG